MTCILAARIPSIIFLTCFGHLLEWPHHCHLTFYQYLEVWEKFVYLMLWGMQLSNLCILDLWICTAGGSNMYVRFLIFYSINDSLFGDSGPLWKAAAMPHHLTNC
jgi:hypothetical protein